MKQRQDCFTQYQVVAISIVQLRDLELAGICDGIFSAGRTTVLDERLAEHCRQDGLQHWLDALVHPFHYAKLI